MLQIYLAGPITGCTYVGCTSWREKFKELLAEVMDDGTDQWRPDEVRCLSPMRAKDYLNQVGVINKDYPSSTYGPLSCSRGIMTRDFYDCTRANLLVVNLLGSEIVSIGTVMELAWAFQARVPAIVVMEKEKNIHEHPMIWEAIGFRVETLEAAAFNAAAVLWPHI